VPTVRVEPTGRVPSGGSELEVAAVLAPVFRDAGGVLRTLLVVRSDRGRHGGQLGFPGGKPEPSDPDLLATALREAHEEVGLDPSTVVVLGELDPLDTRATGFRVHTFVGRAPADTTWTLRAGEIVGVLTPPVELLGDPARRELLPFTSRQFPDGLLVEGVDVDGHVLWGMTLRLLNDLVPRLLAGEFDV
jgi:8-oxo-dGTP pyrophosphatase MutT (NUDIX family)